MLNKEIIDEENDLKKYITEFNNLIEDNNIFITSENILYE